MKRIVFSKQADVDIDLAPFWHHWYRRVFACDLIIITPVLTALSSISLVERFYTARGIPVVPIRIGVWDDAAIWSAQKDILASYLPRDESFVAISADADQYFEPLPDHLPGDVCVYHRINCLSEEPPQPEHLLSFHPRAYASHDLVGGWVNDLNDTNIWLTGHFQGRVPDDPAWPRREFHLHLRGLAAFKQKITRMSIVADGVPTAGDWKIWRTCYDREGEAGLARAYAEHKTRLEKGKCDDSLADLFMRYSRLDPPSDIFRFGSDTRYQFPCALLPAAVRAGNDSFGVFAPKNDLALVHCVMSGEKYPLPTPAVRPSTILDVGAHLGFSAIFLAQRFPGARILCVEPAPQNAEILRSNLGAIATAHVVEAALSDVNGEVPLYIHPSETWLHSLRTAGSAHRSTIVKTHTGDSLLSEQGLPRADIIKVSAPHHEAAVLRGLSANLAHASLVAVEYFSEQGRRECDALLSGYTVIASRATAPHHGVVCYAAAR